MSSSNTNTSLSPVKELTLAFSSSDEDEPERLSAAPPASPLILRYDPDIVDNISKVLIVHDADTSYQEELIEYVRQLGYHPVTLLLTDSDFGGVPQFIQAFQPIARARDYVFGIVHYARTEQEMCMFCCQQQVASSRLMKIAFGSMYVEWGRNRCTILHPEHCCPNDVTLPPARQLKGMSNPYLVYSNLLPAPLVVAEDTDPSSGPARPVFQDGDHIFDEVFWRNLENAILSNQRLDSHNPETRHVLTTDEIQVNDVEEPVLTLEGILDNIKINFVGTREIKEAFALELGLTAMDWNELMSRMPAQALFLVLRKTVYSAKDWNGVLTRVTDALIKFHQSPRMVDAVLAFQAGQSVRASDFLVSSYVAGAKGKEEEVEMNDPVHDSANVEASDRPSEEQPADNAADDGTIGEEGVLEIPGRRVQRHIAMDPVSVELPTDPEKHTFLPPALRATMEIAPEKQRAFAELIEGDKERRGGAFLGGTAPRDQHDRV